MFPDETGLTNISEWSGEIRGIGEDVVLIKTRGYSDILHGWVMIAPDMPIRLIATHRLEEQNFFQWRDSQDLTSPIRRWYRIDEGNSVWVEVPKLRTYVYPDGLPIAFIRVE